MQHKHLFMPLALVSAMAVAQQVYAADDFVVQDIRVDGLVRLTPDNVAGMIPFTAGDRVNDQIISSSIRSLFASGLFDDVKSSQVGNTLVYTVVERPVISKVELKGNKLIPKEALEEGLKKMGLSEGEVLKKSSLQTVETELEQQYMQQGRYDADVKVTTTAQPNNRVNVLIEFVEGQSAKVFDINIIGNTVFKESEIKHMINIYNYVKKQEFNY